MYGTLSTDREADREIQGRIDTTSRRMKFDDLDHPRVDDLFG